MRWLFLVAGLLCLGMGALHAVIGGIETLNPMMASAVALQVRVVIMVLWHAMTVLFVLSGVAFFWAFAADRVKARPMGILLGIFYLLFAALYAGLSFFWFEDPMVLPQWTLLAPIGLFGVIASL